ncbi:MAG: RHS repeat-associated core domain-containing protein, partial [Blastochloris sp.]|nr:RHS repeat-associated core domain-containing protein [Blastochloris sp.]
DIKIENVYDGQSRRVRKIVSTYSSGVWSPTSDLKFLYDGWNLVSVYNAASSNAFTKTFTWGQDLSGSMQGAGGVRGLLATRHLSLATTYAYTYDANGNVSEVVDGSGAVVAHYEYDPFGNTTVSTGSYATENVYRFSTKFTDDESGFLYYGYRFYNPELGRWPNRDPIGEEGGINLYAMVNNNPIKDVDKLGQDRWVASYLHMAVTFDTWSEDCKCKTGKKLVEFQPRTDYSDGTIYDPRWALLATSFMPGQVNIREDNQGGRRITSNCQADKALLIFSEMMQSDPPLYSAFFFNCRNFAAIAADVGL